MTLTSKRSSYYAVDPAPKDRSLVPGMSFSSTTTTPSSSSSSSSSSGFAPAHSWAAVSAASQSSLWSQPSARAGHHSSHSDDLTRPDPRRALHRIDSRISLKDSPSQPAHAADHHHHHHHQHQQQLESSSSTLEKTPEVKTLWVGNLHESVTEQDLIDFFKNSPILRIRLSNNPDTRPCAYVDVPDQSALEKVLRLSGERLHGTRLKIEYDPCRIKKIKSKQTLKIIISRPDVNSKLEVPSTWKTDASAQAQSHSAQVPTVSNSSGPSQPQVVRAGSQGSDTSSQPAVPVSGPNPACTAAWSGSKVTDSTPQIERSEPTQIPAPKSPSQWAISAPTWNSPPRKDTASFCSGANWDRPSTGAPAVAPSALGGWASQNLQANKGSSASVSRQAAPAPSAQWSSPPKPVSSGLPAGWKSSPSKPATTAFPAQPLYGDTTEMPQEETGRQRSLSRSGGFPPSEASGWGEPPSFGPANAASGAAAWPAPKGDPAVMKKKVSFELDQSRDVSGYTPSWATPRASAAAQDVLARSKLPHKHSAPELRHNRAAWNAGAHWSESNVVSGINSAFAHHPPVPARSLETMRSNSDVLPAASASQFAPWLDDFENDFLTLPERSTDHRADYLGPSATVLPGTAAAGLASPPAWATNASGPADDDVLGSEWDRVANIRLTDAPEWNHHPLQLVTSALTPSTTLWSAPREEYPIWGDKVLRKSTSSSSLINPPSTPSADWLPAAGGFSKTPGGHSPRHSLVLDSLPPRSSPEADWGVIGQAQPSMAPEWGGVSGGYPSMPELPPRNRRPSKSFSGWSEQFVAKDPYDLHAPPMHKGLANGIFSAQMWNQALPQKSQSLLSPINNQGFAAPQPWMHAGPQEINGGMVGWAPVGAPVGPPHHHHPAPGIFGLGNRGSGLLDGRVTPTTTAVHANEHIAMPWGGIYEP
ncbi:uncharacterized protein BJ171DRAFT_173914 [Polychytrium aggregatum]|uniref:uncharacterized protein n=1 Tax=Polychytrium aggregatum TaxID=110093 RepID=UPI0022FDC3F4|nr:uncharacterized protein BJ171DRAFT_173914 [Polychytrium aggregatum]KAI9209017.1 hypothetical protein BJ171DRAFT_173914 [Polychytrium aggregatum]